MDQNRARTVFSPKEVQILDVTLQLLIEAGDAGATLRKIAERANMRLSNVQYYFKSRDDLLVAMVAYYFETCIAHLRDVMDESKDITEREKVRFLVRSCLDHGREISDLCRAFREIWAISSRSDAVDRCLIDYYRRFADVIISFAFQTDIDDASRAKLGALLVPYFEGYSITARSHELSAEETVEMLTDLAMSVFEKHQKSS